MSLRSRLDLVSEYPYTEYILRDLSKLFGSADSIYIESNRIVFYFPGAVPSVPSLSIVTGRAFHPESDEFIEVEYAYMFKSELMRVIIDGLVDANPKLRLTINDYGKKKK